MSILSCSNTPTQKKAFQRFRYLRCSDGPPSLVTVLVCLAQPEFLVFENVTHNETSICSVLTSWSCLMISKSNFASNSDQLMRFAVKQQVDHEGKSFYKLEINILIFNFHLAMFITLTYCDQYSIINNGAMHKLFQGSIVC